MNHFSIRLESLKKLLPDDGVAIISSNPSVRYSNDTFYPSHPNTDLRYLTGSISDEISLFVFGDKGKEPVILTHKPNPLKTLWEGELENPLAVAKRINAKLVRSDKLRLEAYELISGYKDLFYQPIEGTLSFNIAREILSKFLYERKKLPRKLTLLDVALAPLRLIKSKDEVATIKRAAGITRDALLETATFIQPSITESFLASNFEYWIKVQGGKIAFPTIVGTGSSAAVLHYRPKEKSLKKGELVLVDCGGAWDGYNADVTRTFPVGEVSPFLVHAYEAVLDAQQAAIESVKPGRTMLQVQEEASKVLIKGLMSLKLIPRKSVQAHLKDGSYKKFFPHGIGHSLGLDVHDVGEIRESGGVILKEGMVVTIEPGLYMSKKKGSLQPFGIRIEDDVLITRKGCELLTSDIPKAFKEVKELCGGN